MSEKRTLGSLELNRVYQMDCIEGMRLLSDDSVDLIIADPPYNIGGKSNRFEVSNEKINFSTIRESWDTIDNFDGFNYTWLSECARVVRKGGSIIVWGTRHNIFSVGYLLEKIGLEIRTIYVWHKRNPMPCLTGRNPTEATEFAVWATKGKRWTYNLNVAKEINDGKNIRNVIETTTTPPSEKTQGKHPSQKRLNGLTDVLIKLHSNEDDIVLIPFCGSGTECVAAVKENRRFITFERESKYIEIANQRLENVRDELAERKLTEGTDAE